MSHGNSFWFHGMIFVIEELSNIFVVKIGDPIGHLQIMEPNLNFIIDISIDICKNDHYKNFDFTFSFL